MLIDLLRILWLAAVTWLLLWGFGAGRRGVRRDPAARIALVARAVVVIVLAVNILTRLHIFNAATLLGTCLAWPAARWLKRYEWAAERAVRSALRAAVLEAVRRAEQPLASWLIIRWMRTVRRSLLARAGIARRRMDRFSAAEMAVAAAAAAGLAAAVYLRVAPVVGETRLGDPRLYGTLLNARQALFNTPDGFVSVLSALSAALSTAASMHTVHVVRLLATAVGLASILAATFLVRRATASDGAAVVTLAILAATLPATAGEFDVAILFSVLGALALVCRTPASRHAAVACAAVTGLALTRADLWAIAASAVPLAGAIGAGLACAALAAIVRRLKAVRVELAAAPLACVAMMLWLPGTPGAMYLEYPAAQAQTLEIASSLPRGKWLLVAPIEQMAETYGRGWYEDPASFVERYAARAADPSFDFDVSVNDIFVLVEKRPFKTFSAEPAVVPFATIADPTYRNYRSHAGRASLQARLGVLCESYRRTHAGTSVHYEDNDLIIYRFHLRD